MADDGLSPRADKAFDFARDVAKQILTLATTILGLTVTFLSNVGKPDRAGIAYLEIAWTMFIFSIVFGVATMMSLTGNLVRPGKESPSVYSGGVRLCAGAQITFFVLGTILTAAYGGILLS